MTLRPLCRAVGSAILALALSAPAAQAAEPQPIPSNADVDYQLGGASTPDPRVGIVARDRTDEIADGLYNICYVNAFQTQPGAKRFWRQRMGLVLHVSGKPLADPGWPDEWLLDISTPHKRARLARIAGRWIAGCATSGFDAVEFDNLDSYTRSRTRLKASHATAYARLLVRAAHREGLAAGQKNRAQWDGTRVGFDFAVAEQCGQWDECGEYVQHYGDQVIAIEYRRRWFERTCEQVGDDLPVVLRDRALSPDGPRAWC